SQLDSNDRIGHEPGHLAVRTTGRPHWSPPEFSALSGGRRHYGLRLFPTHDADRVVVGRRADGRFCQWYDWRLWGIDFRAVPPGSPGHRTECAVQYRPGYWRLRTGRGRRAGGSVLL